MSGTGYDDDTTITDDLGNEYVPTIISGSIVKVTPINNKEITSIPVFNIIGTGDGAQLSAVLTDDVPPQGEVKQVIDCVSVAKNWLRRYYKVHVDLFGDK